ncbi:MAG: Dihydroxy-acid dehydratase (EC [uncultured Caballeronia sp.]|nr:MAG: Dihydroxy-acid dehydratase (EC [uncultured Caballeronia sp.]
MIYNLKPSGQYVATDLHKAGGIPPSAEDLARRGHAARRLHHDHGQDHCGRTEGLVVKAAR